MYVIRPVSAPLPSSEDPRFAMAGTSPFLVVMSPVTLACFVHPGVRSPGAEMLSVWLVTRTLRHLSSICPALGGSSQYACPPD